MHTCSTFALILIILFLLFIGFSAYAQADADHLLAEIPTQTLYLGEKLMIDLKNYGIKYENQVKIPSHDRLTLDFNSESLVLTVSSTQARSHALEAGLYRFTIDYRASSAARWSEATVVVRVRPIQRITFRYFSEDSDKRVSIAGNFNNWSYADHVCEYNKAEKSYEITVGMKPGRYEYKVVVDGEWIMDPANPDTVSNGMGGFNSAMVVEGKTNRPGMFIKQWAEKTDDGDIKLTFRFLSGGKGINPQKIIVMTGNRQLPSDRVQYFPDKKWVSATLPVSLWESERVHGKIRLIGEDTEGFPTKENITLCLNNIPRGKMTGDFRDWYDAILYSLMVDRFANGDSTNNNPIQDHELADQVNFGGGDLDGIAQQVEKGYFERLGVTAIWLSPINQAPDKAYYEFSEPRRKYSGYHGYWPVHPTRIEPRFGGENALKSLVDKAHARGMSVMMDFVSNHVHQEHPWFQEHPEWFGTLELPDGRKNLRLFDEHRLTTWFDEFLPSFDFPASPAAVDSMTDNALWWLENFQLDAFRHDAVKHVPNLFWRELTEKIKARFPKQHIYQIGETYGSHKLISSYINPYQLDAQFDFNLLHTIYSIFLSDGVGFDLLDVALEESLEAYGAIHLMGNLIGNHDKTRFITLIEKTIPPDENEKEWGWDHPVSVTDATSYHKLSTVIALIMTIPGVPVIYYGDEIGMPGAGDPDNRRMMRFEDDELSLGEKRHFDRISQLCHIRRERPALRYGDFLTLHADSLTYAYARVHFDETLLIVLNLNPKSKNLSIPISQLAGDRDPLKFVDLITDETLGSHDGIFSLDIPGYGYRILSVE